MKQTQQAELQQMLGQRQNFPVSSAQTGVVSAEAQMALAAQSSQNLLAQRSLREQQNANMINQGMMAAMQALHVHSNNNSSLNDTSLYVEFTWEDEQ